MNRLLALFTLAVWTCSVQADAVDFDRDVKPILTAHCLKCHGAEKQKGGLRLDRRADALAGGNSGAAIVAGRAKQSPLIHAIRSTDEETRMPPIGQQALSEKQIRILEAWINEGVPFPDDEKNPATETPPPSRHWSFQPIQQPAIPQVTNVTHPIDAFIRERSKKEGLAPAPEAERHVLIRRLSFDLLGLPPTSAEVTDFVKDRSSNAYEKLVDRLLASPHYGERWGRHWLDVARYADSDGYEKDTGRPFAWRYRDYVIRSLNQDLHFDQFTIEQLAGDLLPNPTDSQKIATGFHRNTLTNKEGGVDREEFRVASVVDRVSTTGTVWLGLTIACAQCHDHKYDPISQREFYQFFAFFNSDQEADLSIPLPGEKEKLANQQAAYDATLAKLTEAVHAATKNKLPADEVKKRKAALAAHQKKAPAASKARTLSLGPTRTTQVLLRGDFLRPGVEVKPGTPRVLPIAEGKSTTRLDLAKWIVDAKNPLTARVIANWIWSKYFGRGLVSTLDDFGTQGEPPSHPELLDWLAHELQDPARCDWSLKAFHKRIVMSATYRQSSRVLPEQLERDPLNVLLSRQQRLRLEAEIIRDNALSVSGLLTDTVGGPSIRPPQPAGISELTYAGAAKWVESTGADRYKRGMYIWFQRTSPYPMLMTFDEPDSNVCVVRRDRSNSPLQALTLLNDTVFVEASQALAKRVVSASDLTTDAERVSFLFTTALSRKPTRQEATRLLALLHECETVLKASPIEAKELLGAGWNNPENPALAAAWVVVCRTVMNLDEFVTRE